MLVEQHQNVANSLTLTVQGPWAAVNSPGTFEAAGFRLNEHLYDRIIGRYSDGGGNMDVDSFISCLVRLVRFLCLQTS